MPSPRFKLRAAATSADPCTGARKARRLRFASLAYVLMTALRRMALQGTELAHATAGTIRLKLLKLGALVTISVRRIKIAIASACPVKGIFLKAHRRLCFHA